MSLMNSVISSLGSLGQPINSPYQNVAIQTASTTGTSSIVGGGLRIEANGVVKAKAFIEVDPDAPPFEINHEAMQASLETLKNLWLAAYSDRWVRRDELDGFQFISAARLHQARMMERFFMPNSEGAIYRIIEN